MDEITQLGILFGGVVLVSFLFLQLASARRQRIEERMKAIAAETGESTPELVLGDMTEGFGGMMPLRGERGEEVKGELMEAGFYSGSASMEYAAVRAMLVFLPLIVAAVLAVLADKFYIPFILGGGVMFAFLGYSIPRVWLTLRAQARKRQIEKGLPTAIDLLALGLLGGQHIFSALQRVSHELRNSFPELARELTIVREQAMLNTLPHALDQWAKRVNIVEVHNLVVVLNQSSRHGSDVATGLLEFSNNFRTSLRQRAETQANRAGFWMLFPSIFFLWLPAFAMLVAPIFFELSRRGDEALEAMRDSKKQADQLIEQRPGLFDNAKGFQDQPGQ